MLPIVILAGGLATRLRPLTTTIPKALLPIRNIPFVTHQLKLLSRKGFTDVVLCVGYLGEQIQDFLSTQTFNLNINYSFDGDNLLGTAGAIKNALHLLPQQFFVLNGDSYLPCDYASIQSFYFTSQKKALMSVFNNQDRWDKSNVELEGRTIKTYNKKDRRPTMHYIDYGLSIFDKSCFDKVVKGVYCDLQEVYQPLIQESQLAAFEVKERFYENGSFDGIKDLEAYTEKYL